MQSPRRYDANLNQLRGLPALYGGAWRDPHHMQHGSWTTLERVRGNEVASVALELEYPVELALRVRTPLVHPVVRRDGAKSASSGPGLFGMVSNFVCL